MTQYIKKTLVTGTPLLAGLFTEHLLYIADSVMVGRLGTEHLAAIAIAALFAEILWCILLPIAPGTQSLASRRHGKQEIIAEKDLTAEHYKEVGEVFDNSILVSVITGAGVFFIACFSHDILILLFEDKRIIQLAESYIRIIKWVMPVATIYYSAYGFLSAINLTKVVMVVSLEINLLNIGFNYLLIYGKLGLPQLGIEGAAWGALLAHILGVAHLLIIILSSKKIKKYQCLRFNRIQPRLLLDIAKVTAPVATQELAALSVFLLFESIVSKIGILYLAITHIVFSVCEFNRTIVGGFAKGASILIGNCLGRGERKEAVRFAYASEVIAFCVGTVILFVVLFFPSLVVQIFNSDAETVAAGSAALRFFAVFFFIEIMGFSFEIIFSHNGWGKYVLFSEFSTNMIFMLGVTFYLTAILNKGIYGAWTGFALYIVFHACILFAGFMSQKWLDVQVETE